MKKILFISYYFPPIHSVESTMAFNVVKYLPDFGWEPFVVSAKESKIIGGDASPQTKKGHSIIRVKAINNFITRGLYSLKLITDPEIAWLPFALSAAKKVLQSEKIDVVISRSNPISSHLIVLLLRRHKKLSWVALYGDPGAQHPYIKYRLKLLRKIHEWVDRKVISTADKVIVTNIQTKRIFEEKYNNSEKITIMPNTYDPEELGPFLRRTSNRKKDDKFVILHSGLFYNLRSPKPFLRGLRLFLDEKPEAKNNLKVRFIGSMGGFESLINRYNLDANVEVVRPIPHKEIFKEIAKAQLLLLIDASLEMESPFLPTKLVEYIVFRKPILGITSLKGASADAIRATNTGIVVSPSDITGIKNAILHYYTLYKKNKLTINPNWEEVEKYNAKNYAKNFTQLLNSLI